MRHLSEFHVNCIFKKYLKGSLSYSWRFQGVVKMLKLRVLCKLRIGTFRDETGKLRKPISEVQGSVLRVKASLLHVGDHHVLHSFRSVVFLLCKFPRVSMVFLCSLSFLCPRYTLFLKRGSRFRSPAFAIYDASCCCPCWKPQEYGTLQHVIYWCTRIMSL